MDLVAEACKGPLPALSSRVGEGEDQEVAVDEKAPFAFAHALGPWTWLRKHVKDLLSPALSSRVGEGEDQEVAVDEKAPFAFAHALGPGTDTPGSTGIPAGETVRRGTRRQGCQRSQEV